MSVDVLLSMILLVSFLVTIVFAIGSYVAYKLRETRRIGADARGAPAADPLFERIIDIDEAHDELPRRPDAR